MWQVLALAALLMVSPNCGSAPSGGQVHDETPDWLRRLILRLEQAPVANPPRHVARYVYRNALVYYLPPSAGDQMSTLYDRDGAVLCAPDGGLTGRGDGKCPDFFTARRNEQIVWRDPRSG